MLLGAAFLAVFFTSGFAALLYQIVWQRMLALFGGADIQSITIIVSAFMAGLGFGSLAGGHLADRLRARGRLIAFAGCELAVAVFAAASPAIYYDLLYVRLGDWALPRAALAALVFLVTLWPTFFMGMSLPLLSTALTRDARQPARWVPILYGWNTLGAAAGSLSASVLLFRTFDFSTSVRIGALLSLACATVALAAALVGIGSREDANRKPDRGADAATPRAVAPPALFNLRTWIAIYALSGFVALSLEIVWFRVLGVILKSNAFTFGHLLGVYLAGIAAGALAATRRWAQRWSPAPAFFLAQSAIPVLAVMTLMVFMFAVDRLEWTRLVWEYLGQYETLAKSDIVGAAGPHGGPNLRLLVLLYVVVPAWLIGLPTLLMGASFGFLQRAVQTDLDALGRRVGWLQTANIVGSMIGAMLTGLVLLDWLGSAGTLRLLVCCGAVFLALFFQSQPRRISLWQRVAAFSAISMVVVLMPSAQTMWARLHAAEAQVVVQREDGSGLSLLKEIGGEHTVVYANGIGQSVLPYGGLHTVLGALPAMIHPGPAMVAVIGLGSGDTTFGVGGRAETKTIDSIEIVAPELETLFGMDARQPYAGLRMLLADHRIRHWFTDGRAFIRKGQRRYDIIEADALRPTSAYAGNLYSVEYFELLRDHLNPGGLAVTWAPTPRVVNSIVTAFPHALLFDDLAIGSPTPIVFDRAAIRERMASTFTRDYYARGGIDLDHLLSPFLNAQPRVISPADDRRPLSDVNRDLFPKDEFAIPQSDETPPTREITETGP